MSGPSFRAFAKDARDFAAAEKRQHRWDQEITGRGNVQELTNIDGTKPGNNKNAHRRRRADPVTFSGERPLGAPIPKTLSSDGKKPVPKKNDGAGKVVPKTFSERIEKPPDGLFKTKNVQNMSPWKPHKGATPLDMNLPPMTVKGQNRFPVGKQETEEAWRKLMSRTGIHNESITAMVEKPTVAVGGGALAPPAPHAMAAPASIPGPAPAPAPAPSPFGFSPSAISAMSDIDLKDTLARLPLAGTDARADKSRALLEAEVNKRKGAKIIVPKASAISTLTDAALNDWLTKLPPVGTDTRADRARALMEAEVKKRKGASLPGKLKTSDKRKIDKMTKSQVQSKLTHLPAAGVDADADEWRKALDAKLKLFT